MIGFCKRCAGNLGALSEAGRIAYFADAYQIILELAFTVFTRLRPS